MNSGALAGHSALIYESKGGNYSYRHGQIGW
jgi:hypothetical protein